MYLVQAKKIENDKLLVKEVFTKWFRILNICKTPVKMEPTFKIGDHVKWNSEAGYVSGKIIKIHTADFDYKGYVHHATEEDPQYAIQSDKTDHIAVHKGKALTKLRK